MRRRFGLLELRLLVADSRPEQNKARAKLEDDSFDADVEPSYAEIKALLETLRDGGVW